MQPFMNADFLLPDASSRRLYHDYAAAMPIIDYHCHLPPADIANDSCFKNMAHAWLGGDHYKWRAMRSNGVPEEDITGHEPDYRTFLAWAKTVPRLVGNPLYHWTHLELQRYFGIYEPLSEKTAPKIWEACNAQIVTPEFGARALLKRMKVRAVGTTDDPADSLEHHIAYAAARQPGDPVMTPSFRPDKALVIEDLDAWRGYLAKLGSVADVSIWSYQDLVKALDKRHAAFHDLGCRASDHGLVVPFATFATPPALESIFVKLLDGKLVTQDEADAFKTAILLEVGRMNAARGW
ncbi:MAG: glucuronate isomerase, partial [Propionivibrio sp.]|nr:glucuronate isomerase [Propionivibrio sp.]